MRWFTPLCLLVTAASVFAETPIALTHTKPPIYVDELNPYYPHRDFPKLSTPRWIGDTDTECAVILAIDDMRSPKQYEAFLRPILRRLKAVDGRSAMSIMTCAIDPQEPQLQAWLKEGVSLECHTIDHPCPFFKPGFAKAKETYDRCVDLMNAVPGNRPVAFRMPCCDSLNTPSPRFWAEIFDKTTAQGNYLSLDSSVFNVFTSADPELPRALVLDDKGQERFIRYLPADRSFVNTIENYPYPYLIGRRCWEFPCVTPSDWEAQHLQKPNNPNTVRDLKAALDCAVAKKGVFCLVFHPHGWIRNDQIVELIDHAVTKHGKKVKFLNFREAHDLLAKNLQGDHSLRDGFFDKQTPSWWPVRQLWQTLPTKLPDGLAIRDANGHDNGVRFVDLNGDGKLDIVYSNEKEYAVYLRGNTGWKKIRAGKRGDADALPMISRNGTNNGFWVHSGQLWWSNEDTVLLKDHVDRRSLKQLLDNAPASEGR
jgi:peptidoglycan/xylan/chitin deacetylase (PgdA/CDA1 family)